MKDKKELKRPITKEIEQNKYRIWITWIMIVLMLCLIITK